MPKTSEPRQTPTTQLSRLLCSTSYRTEHARWLIWYGSRDPGGQVAAYVWDYAGRMQLMRYFWDAAVELKPENKHLDEGVRFPLCQPTALTELFEKSGLKDVHVSPLDVSTHFRDFDDYWTPFLGGQFPAPIMRCRSRSKTVQSSGNGFVNAYPSKRTALLS